MSRPVHWLNSNCSLIVFKLQKVLEDPNIKPTPPSFFLRLTFNNGGGTVGGGGRGVKGIWV